VALDAKGFVLTGPEAELGRDPVETSRRGVFAIGDVRSRSVKRVGARWGRGHRNIWPPTLHPVGHIGSLEEETKLALLSRAQ
jgi:hypothetical protein